MNRGLASAALLILAAAALRGYGQDKPPAAPRAARIGVFELKPCFDKDKVDWVKDIDQELQKIADDIGKRMKEAEPKERERLRADYLEYYNRKKLAIYTEVNRIAEAIGREKGFTLVLKSDPIPTLENSQVPLSQQMEQRAVLYHEAETDITDELIRRLNESYAERKKKGKDKEKDF